MFSVLTVHIRYVIFGSPVFFTSVSIFRLSSLWTSVAWAVNIVIVSMSGLGYSPVIGIYSADFIVSNFWSFNALLDIELPALSTPTVGLKGSLVFLFGFLSSYVGGLPRIPYRELVLPWIFAYVLVDGCAV